MTGSAGFPFNADSYAPPNVTWLYGFPFSESSEILKSFSSKRKRVCPGTAESNVTRKASSRPPLETACCATSSCKAFSATESAENASCFCNSLRLLTAATGLAETSAMGAACFFTKQFLLAKMQSSKTAMTIPKQRFIFSDTAFCMKFQKTRKTAWHTILAEYYFSRGLRKIALGTRASRASRASSLLAS